MRILVWLLLIVVGLAHGGTFPEYDALRRKAKRHWDSVTASNYVVLLAEASPLRPAAEALAKHRRAEIVEFDPAAPERSLAELIRRDARYVAVFVEPADMDVNLLRRMIVISTLMDEDPFCDFGLGFFTASTPEKAKAFVDRSIGAKVKPYALQVSASNISHCYENWSFVPGLPGASYFVKTGDLGYATKALAELPRAGFIHLGGCADPEGIWLFDDHRNLDPSKHWPFDPDKVGQDPKGEMPRITAEFFAKLTLDGAVVWTHACHIGSVSRIWVEGDIVSTFGRCEKVEEYRIPAGRSVALAIIEAGASAYIAPLGPNHGGQAAIEKAFASETGACLGDVMRRAYHDLVMDTEGHPERIGVYVTGKPARWDPDDYINYNSPQHRALYGDPMMRPFGKHRSPPSVKIKGRAPGTVEFEVARSGYQGRTLYGNRRLPGAGRIYEVLPVEGRPRSVEVRDPVGIRADGSKFAIIRATALLERIDGGSFVHLQLVTDDRKALQTEGSVVRAPVVVSP
jgi:hypothetical protein